MELLIVVAIVAILAVIAIPVMKSAVTDAADAANLANERAAKAVAAVSILLDDGTNFVTNKYFDNDTGKFVSAKPAGYGKKGTVDNDNKVIEIKNVNADTGAFDLEWV